MFGIGTGELIIILVVIFLVFGPDRLPELAKTIGKVARDIRSASDEVKSAVMKDTTDVLKDTKAEVKQEIGGDLKKLKEAVREPLAQVTTPKSDDPKK